MSSRQRQKRNTPWLVAMALLAVGYGVLLFTLQTFTGKMQVDGVIGIVLGLYICSHPAANLVDKIIFGRFHFQQGRPWRDIGLWWGLNILVMFLGLAVIFSGTTRFMAR